MYKSLKSVNYTILPLVYNPCISFQSHTACLRCSSANHPYARFCASCGAFMEPPERRDARNTGRLTSGVGVRDALHTMDSRYLLARHEMSS